MLLAEHFLLNLVVEEAVLLLTFRVSRGTEVLLAFFLPFLQWRRGMKRLLLPRVEVNLEVLDLLASFIRCPSTHSTTSFGTKFRDLLIVYLFGLLHLEWNFVVFSAHLFLLLLL